MSEDQTTPPDCQHEFPDDRPRTYSLAEFEAICRRDARLLDENNREWSHRMGYKTTDSRFHGELASQVYALVTGWGRRIVLGRRGDGGADYPDGCNVKSAVPPYGGYYDRPHLIVNVNQHLAHKGHTVKYALAEVNLSGPEGRLLVVVTYDRAGEGILIDPGRGADAVYRRIEARHERASLARDRPGVCMVCGLSKPVGFDPARTQRSLFEPPPAGGVLLRPPAPVPGDARLQKYGSLKRLEETRDYIAQMRRLLQGEKEKPDVG